MTISSTYAPVQYNGNGVTTVFPFPYEFYNSTDLIVKSTVIATGATTTLTSPTDYSVSGGSGSTGNVTFVSAPASTVRITIECAIPYTQGQDYQENTAFPAATIETGFDKSVIMAQQTKALTDYALKFETTDPPASIGTIPNSVARANAILSFDALGKPSAVTLASLGSSINVSLTSPQNGDALVYNAGVWNNRSVLASLGTNIASATTTAISAADSDFVTVTGTTTITSFGTPASFARKHIWVVFSGALTLTHNATSLILPGGASITTAAGDVAECVHISGANWRVVTYQRASGAAVSGGNIGLTLIATTTVSSPVASVDFVNGVGGVVFNGTYKSYILEIINLIPATDNTEIFLRTTSNTGVSYDSGATDYHYNASVLVSSGSLSANGNQAAQFAVGGATCLCGLNANENANAIIKIQNPAFTGGYKTIYSNQFNSSNVGTEPTLASVVGHRRTASAIDGFRILMSAGNITSAVFKLYGCN